MSSGIPRIYTSFAEFEREELRRLDSLHTSVDDLVEERFAEDGDFGQSEQPRRRGRPRKHGIRLVGGSREGKEHGAATIAEADRADAEHAGGVPQVRACEVFFEIGGPVIVGIGIGAYVEPCGQGWESGAVRIEGEQPDTITLEKTDYLVEGVIGTIPQ